MPLELWKCPWFWSRGHGTKDTRNTIQQFILADTASDSWGAFQKPQNTCRDSTAI